MNILKLKLNRYINHIVSWQNFSWLENVGYVPCMDIPMPPIEIGFVYLELSNDIESFYSTPRHKKQCL